MEKEIKHTRDLLSKANSTIHSQAAFIRQQHGSINSNTIVDISSLYVSDSRNETNNKMRTAGMRMLNRIIKTVINRNPIQATTTLSS